MIKTVKADKNGNLYLQFSKRELAELGLKVGDAVEWNTCLMMKKKETKKHDGKI